MGLEKVSDICKITICVVGVSSEGGVSTGGTEYRNYGMRDEMPAQGRNEGMKVVFISNILRQARCLRRIQDFIDRGYEVKVYGFDREGDCRALPTFEYECVGVIANGDAYLKRLFVIREGVSKVFKKEGKNCLYYIFSLDIAIVAKLLSYIPLSPTDSSPKQGSS